MSASRDRFRIEGDCWCDDSLTLQHVRVMGHTEACTNARKGWQANYAHLSELGRQQREDEAAGRQLRQAAAAVLRPPTPEGGNE